MRPATRPVVFCLLLMLPAIILRLSATELAAPVSLFVYSLGVIAASFVLAWAR